MSDKAVPHITNEQEKVLNAFSRALDRESHVLTQHPDILWQQLYNRLQWGGDEIKQVLAFELAHRSEIGSKPWLHTRAPFRESEALIRTLTGHTKSVSGCAISPDGSFIVSASSDKSLKVWDVGTGLERLTLTGHTNLVNSCAISPDGSFIVSASSDLTLKVWDTGTGAERSTLSGHTDTVRSCTISHDGRWVVSGSSDNTLKVWDPLTGAELATLRGHVNAVEGCSINPDGSFIVSASTDGTLKVWEVPTWKELITLRGKDLCIYSCVISHDCKWIVSAGTSSLQVWGVGTGLERLTLSGHTKLINSCAISPDGSFIVSASSDNTLKVWDAATGKERITLIGHTDWVSGCAISPDGNFIVSASKDYTLKVWDAGMEEDRTTLQGANYSLTSCAISPDGDFIVCANSNNILNVLHTGTTAELACMYGHTDEISGCAISSDGALIVSASRDKTLKVWDSATGHEITTLTGHTGGVNKCIFSPDSDFIISLDWDEILKVWDTETWAERTTLTGLTGHISQCAISPDGSYVVCGSAHKTLKVWDAVTGEELTTLTGHTGGVNSCAISPDGNFIVSVDWDKNLKVWNTRTWANSITITSHTAALLNCAISPDGSYIISTSADGILKVWDAVMWVERFTLAGHTGRIQRCTISPDGHLIVTSSNDRTLKVWNARTGSEIVTLPLSGDLLDLAFHPSYPLLMYGERGGTLFILDIIGIEYGSLIVTSVDHGSGPILRCPACRQTYTFETRWLGRELTCPNPNCSIQLRVNPFVLGKPQAISENGVTVKQRDIRIEPRLLAQPRILVGHQDKVTAVAVARDGLMGISGSVDCTVRVWDLRNGALLHTLLGHDVSVVTLALAADGQQAVSVSNDAKFRVWDLKTGAKLKRLRDDLPVQTVALAKDRQIAVVASGKVIRVWDLEKGAGWSTKVVDIGSLTASGLSPNGDWAVFGSDDGKFFVLHLERELGEREVLRVTCPNQLQAVAVSAYGQRAIIALEDNTIRVWDIEQQIELYTLTGHSATVTALALSSGNRLLVSVSQDGILKVWDIEKGELIKSFSEGSRLCSCAIAADESKILAGDDLGRIYILQINGDQEQDGLIQQAARSDEINVHTQANYLKSEGEKLIELKEFEKALNYFERGLKFAPSDFNMLSLQVSALLKLDRSEEASDIIDYILDNNLATGLNLANMYGTKGHSLVGMGKHEEALDYYRKAIEKGSTARQIWYMQGYVLQQLGKYQAAIDSLLHAQEIEEDEDAHLLIGYCYMSMEEYSKAEQVFRSMLEHGSKNPFVYHGLGLILIYLDKIDEACQWLQRFLEDAQAEHQHLVADVKTLVEGICLDIH